MHNNSITTATVVCISCAHSFPMQGKLKYRETVTEGFDNMFDAFLGLFTGENTGKAVVKV